MDAPDRILDLSRILNPGIITAFSLEEEAERIFQGEETEAEASSG